MTREEFTQLYKDKHKDWIGFTRSLLVNHPRLSQAEEILQDIWEKSWFHVAHIQANRNVKSYMLRKIKDHILSNVWLGNASKREYDRYKKLMEQAEPISELVKEIHIDYHAVEDDEPTPLQQALTMAFKDLTADEHDIICMFLEAEMSFEEIAQALNRVHATDEYNMGRVKMRYHRALPKLRLALASVGISRPTCGDSTRPDSDQTAA